MKKTMLVFLVLILLTVTLTGCQKSAAATINVPSETILPAKPDDALASIEEKSNALKASLENDALTQTDMNQKAQELHALWEAALSDVLVEAKHTLSEEAFAKLTDEQNAWMSERETAVKAAGKDVEGGSLYALTVAMESARITQERVYALYALVK